VRRVRRRHLFHVRERWLQEAGEAAATPVPIGHNNGPPLEPDEDPGALSWRGWCWRRAHKRAWKTPPREIALRRLARAEALGITYRAYTLEILERGVYL
jgi:hypothetical protein